MMDINGYQVMAQRTVQQELTDGELVYHALFGMASEVGELQGLYQKYFQGHGFDPDHAMKEVGDLLWFVAEYCTAMGWWLGDVAQANIAKLQKRYPMGFDAQRSVFREEGDL